MDIIEKPDYTGKVYTYKGDNNSQEKILVDTIPPSQLGNFVEKEMKKIREFLFLNPSPSRKRLIQIISSVSSSLANELPYLNHKNVHHFASSLQRYNCYLTYSRSMRGKEPKRLSELTPGWLSCAGQCLFIKQNTSKEDRWALYNDICDDQPSAHVKLVKKVEENVIILDPALSHVLGFRFVLPIEEFYKENVPSKFVDYNSK